MNRVLTAVLLLATLVGASACSETAATTHHSEGAMFQMSAVNWNDIAAATDAAHVENNSLIMMR